MWRAQPVCRQEPKPKEPTDCTNNSSGTQVYVRKIRKIGHMSGSTQRPAPPHVAVQKTALVHVHTSTASRVPSTHSVMPAVPVAGLPLMDPPVGHDVVVMSTLAGTRTTPRLQGTLTAARKRYPVLGLKDPGGMYSCIRTGVMVVGTMRGARSALMAVPAASSSNRDHTIVAPTDASSSILTWDPHSEQKRTRDNVGRFSKWCTGFHRHFGI